LFFRIAGSTNALHTLSFSPTTTGVSEGYYLATNLTAVDVELTSGNLVEDVTILGVTGTAVAASGTATEAEVLEGSSFSRANAGGLIGTMPNIGAVTITPGTAPQPIERGYHDGAGSVAGDLNLASENIKAGTTIFGVTGRTEIVDTSSGNATAGDIMEGITAWVDGVEITGAITTQTPSAESVALPAGHYASTNLAEVDPDLTSASIRAGVAVFGVVGKPEVVDTTSGDATAADLVDGVTAWVDGAEIIGSRTAAPVPRTGQVNTFRAGDDGDLEAGTVWPEPRFTVQADSALVRDNLTGLMWTRSASPDGPKEGLARCHRLLFGAGSWRLLRLATTECTRAAKLDRLLALRSCTAFRTSIYRLAGGQILVEHDAGGSFR
jgi:hypothetical protein